MIPPAQVRSLPGFLVLITLLLATCAQGPAPADDAELKIRIREYMGILFPQFQSIEITSIEDYEGPFRKAIVELKSGGNTQKSEAFLTEDGGYLVLGQVWDLNMDPMRARWEQKKQNSTQRQTLIDTTDRPARGKLDSPVVLVEYSDYQCPYCSRAYLSLEKPIYEQFKDRVKFVFKHLPLESLHPWAKKASVAAACTYVQEPAKFWDMHALLFENQKSITSENLRSQATQYATQLSLDLPSFVECFDSDKTAVIVETDLREAQSLGLSSTPTFMINGAQVTGVVSVEEMAAYLTFALEDNEVESQ